MADDSITIKLNEPLAPYTSWRVGGAADRLCIVSDIRALSDFLKQVPAEEPLFWMGKGSNLLVRDGGVRGTVILLEQREDGIEILPSGQITAEAGVPLSRLAHTARSVDQNGFNFLAGIPGSVGGALAMNAGAFGEEIWPLVESVEVMDRDGELHCQTADHYSIGYRTVVPKESAAAGWFVSATFHPVVGEQNRESLQQQLKQRNQSQPMAEYSCGSVFRNPPGEHAGQLIEQCGLKGHCIGAACVSERHANFIVHRGGATANEIESLIEYVAETVQQQQGVQLVPEVRIVGENRG